jgi:transcriptional regulator with XRE-family HTH domain
MVLLRGLLGDALRRRRQQQGRTLREVSGEARVSLGYLSEVERGQKEASSELLSSICSALGMRMSELMHEVGDELAALEPAVLESAPLEPALLEPAVLTVVEDAPADPASVVAAA